MDAGKQRKIHNVNQTKNITPIITRETAFSQQICELVFGVNIFDVDLAVQVDSVQQPILRDSMGSRHVSPHRTSSFDDHLYHSFVVFKNVQLSFALRRMPVRGHMI